MDVRMPDGTIVTGVPEGITQTELLARYNKYTPAQPAAIERPALGSPMGEDFGSAIMGTPRMAQTAQPPLVQPNGSINAQDYLAAVAKRKEENPERSVSDVAVDSGVTLLKSAIGLPEAFVGLADIPTMGRLGKFLEEQGYKPKEAKEILDTYLSEAQQAANRKVGEAKGFGPKVLAGLQNPSVIVSSAVESLPQMVGGAGIARGLMKVAPALAPWMAGALGEGILGAGSAAEQMREEAKTGVLTPKQSLAALGSGAGTAAFGAVAGRLANKLGLNDVETMLATGSANGRSKSIGDFAKRAGASGVSEGVFEELPQSAQEQMWMNYATDKPLMEGVAEASAMGLLTGAAMGMAGTGAGQLLSRREKEVEPSAEQMMRERGFLVPEQKKPAGIAALVEPNAPQAQPPATPVTPPAQEEQPAGIAALQPKAPEPAAPAAPPAAAPAAPPAAPVEETSVDRDAMLQELEAILGNKPAEEPVTAPEVKPAEAQEPATTPVGRPGYNTPVEVNAKALKDAFETSSGESLVTKPEKLEAWRNGTAKTNPITSPIEVGFSDNGKFGINDGRHRIALAAEQGKNVTVMVDENNVERLKNILSAPAAPAAKPAKPPAAPAVEAKTRPSTPEIYNAIIDGWGGKADKLPEATRKWMTDNGLIQGKNTTPLGQRLMDTVKQAQEQYQGSQSVEILEAMKRGEPMPTPKSMTTEQMDQVVDKFIEANKPKTAPKPAPMAEAAPAAAPATPVAEEPKLTAEEIYKTLRKDEKAGNPIDDKMIKSMDLETAKAVSDKYRRYRINNFGRQSKETLLGKALDEHIKSIPQPSYAEIMAEVKAKQGNTPTQLQRWQKEHEEVKKQLAELQAKEAADKDFDDALSDLGMILTKGVRKNMMPEQEQALLPVLTRLMDAAFRKGYYKFKEAAKFVMDTIRSKLGNDAADMITLDHLQGAYIGMAGKYQDQGASSKKDVVAVESLDELNEAAPEEEELFTLSNPEQKFEVAQAIAEHFTQGEDFPNIVAARAFISQKFGIEIRPGSESAKQADETIEAGVVLAARDIVEFGRQDNLTVDQIYEKLVDLYERQPNLNVRSSTSVANQAYSTPAPLAYVASELAGITNKTTVYEPTAGNGMLLIAANPSNVVANELNQDRFDMLKLIMDGAEVVNKNAINFQPDLVEVVIANPPFGAIGEEVEVGGKKTREIDHAISYTALSRMEAGGKAVLIVGGVNETTEDARREGYRSKAKREFYYNLYKDYNVVDHFTVAGNMYAKQGASYPVDVIVIDGKGQSQRNLPAADLPQVIKSYDQLKEKLNDRMVSGEDRGTSRTNRGVSEAGTTGRENVDLGTGVQGNGPGTAGRGTTEGGGTSVQGNEPATGGRREPAGGRAGNAQPGSENATERGGQQPVAGTSETAKRGERAAEGRGPAKLGGVSVVSGERVGSSLTDRAGQEQETEGQVGYAPFSNANSVGTLVPKAMAEAINNSLATLEAEVGSIDEYVATALEIDPETLRELFSAEQVDALALSIRNAEAGKGFIIGDQTGVGKGRVVAAMIRYALVNGKVPIFVTEKPNLYSDMIRDLDDIGMTSELGLDTANPKILITNNDEKIPYTLLRDVNGKIVENNLILKAPQKDAKLDAVFKRMQDSESLGDYKVIFTTYNQLQTVKGKDTERRRLIKQFGAGNYMIFDESHNAGGAGETQARTKEQREKAKEGQSLATGRAAFVRNLVQNAYGTFFSSATYAKKPDVMDLYSSTDMKLAVNNLNDLAEAIKNGGIPMQQTVANMLAQAGQYIRRERTFAGVSYDTTETKVDKQTAENMASSMRDILAFSRAKEIAVKDIKKQLDKRGAAIAGGPAEKTQVASANFGSIMHNLIDQMLLSLKVQSSIDHAIERLKAGEKVVMTVSNTMGSFLKDYADEMGLVAGDKVDLSFKDMYLRYLEKQRVIKIKSPGGKVDEYRLTDADLGPGLVQQFNNVKAFIEGAGFGAAPISPIDYLHSELNKAGYKTEEITGRTVTVNYSTGKPLLASRNSSIAKRVQAVKNFNNGTSDVMILNQAGSTGLSLHASSRVDDKRKRNMIIIQPEKNIDTHMQMLGRVHRTGQVIPPAYSQMMADIPAEMRPAAVLLKKMASLNANTTGSRKSAVSAEGAVDFMNDYGGQVVTEFLRDNPEVYQALGGKKVIDLSDDPSEANEDDIRKVTGYIPILPIKQQEEIYKDLVERYKDLIEREDSMGSNKLEAKAEDLDAKTIESKQITEDKQNETGSQSVFAKPAMMERVDVKRTVKPYSQAEVNEQIQDSLNGQMSTAVSNEMLRDLRERVTTFGKEQVAAMESAKEPDPVKIENFKSQLNSQFTHAKTVAQTFPIGTPVSIKNTNGVFVYGVVTNIEAKGKTKNPVAGSDLKMTIALANGDAKSLPLTFSQIGSTYTLKQEDEVPWFNQETERYDRIPLMELFDKGATVRREKRWMVTGNILAGYAAVNNMGQIMTYTKDDGTTAQGVLMPRTFDFEKEQKNAPVKLNSAEAVMAFFDKFGPRSIVGTPDNVLKIIYSGGTQYKFTTSSAKREGGTFFLDKDLTNITGDFYKSGSVMTAAVYGQNDVRAAIKYLLSDRGESLIALTNKEEARAAFQPPLANIEPTQNQKMLNPYMAAEVDREELIRRFQSARQSRAAIVRKFIKGEAGLTEQAKITELDEVAKGLKAAIEKEKPERREAKNFFRDATDRWEEGSLSDAVYEVIRDVYDKYPFVLEGLKLSVPKTKRNAAGSFDPAERFVYLYKGTSGVEDPTTIRHELVHSLEQMMSEEATVAVIEEWHKQLERKIKSEKTAKGKAFFDKLMAFYDKPTLETYEIAMDALPSYDYYQYMNPSEYWAVNAEPLMARKLGSGWDRFVLGAKRLYETLKNLFGFDNKSAIHRAFNEVMSGKEKRIGNAALVNYVTSEKVLLNNQNTRKNYKGGPAPLASWTSANESKLDDFIYSEVDKHIDAKRVVQAITHEIGDIADRWNPYLKETLYHGRTAKQTEDFLSDELRPLLQDMAKRNVSVPDFEFYLQNRHAQAYNELVASRNSQMPDGGSGIFTQDAQDYLANLTKEEKANFEALAKEVDKIVRGTQDILVDQGLEKAETIETWNEKLPDYVPLQRDPDELDFVSTGSGLGRGYSSGGKFVKTATGSLKTVVDIIGNIALQRERAIVRSEKARVGRALYGLAITSPNPDFWMPVNPAAIKSKKKLTQELINMGMTPADAENIIQEPRVPRFDKQTGQVVYEVNPAMRKADNVFSVRVNGEDRFIFFNPGDPRAKRMVEAMQNLDAQQLGDTLGKVAELTRTIAAMNTQYNPVFGAWNFARDVMGATVNLAGTPLEKKKLAVLAGVNPLDGMPALRAVYRDLRGKEKNTPEMQSWIDLYEQYQKAGAQTGYREQFSRSKERATIVQREMEKLDRGNVRKVADSVFQWLSDYNDAMENAVRLSAFKVALEEGMSEDQAANLAKNLTVNFNRKGQKTIQRNALYAFYNASVQGTARMAELLITRTPDGNYQLSSHGKKIIVGGLMVGVAQAVLLSMAGFGEDEPPEFLKNKNLIIPTGGGNYLIIPTPMGLNVFPNVARTLTEFIMSDRKSVSKTAVKLFNVLLDTFNPLGASGLAQTIAPTVLDPIIAIATNKDAFGRPIAREDRATNPTPGYMRSRENATALSKSLAYAINYMTGGGKYGIGAWSPTADQLDYLAGQYTGGVGRETMKAVRFVAAKAEGEETPSYSVPILGKLYGETSTPSAITDKFYKNVIMLAEHEGTLKRMRAEHISTVEYRNEYPEVRLIQNANNLENEISKLNKNKRELLEKEQTDYIKARIKRIDEQKARMMKQFNDRVRAAEK